MAKIESTTFRNWNNGETMYEADYEQEREIIRTAINDNYDRLIKKYEVLNTDGTVRTTQSLDKAINYLRFKDTSEVIFSLDNLTSTLTLGVVDGSITTAKLANLNVTTPKIADGNVTTIKIADLNVTRGKIADGAVNLNKLDLVSLDSRYYTETELDAGQLDNRYYTETEIDGKVTNLQNQITSNDGDITNLQNEDTNLQNQITSNDSDISNLQTKDDNLQNQINSNDLDIQDLKNTDSDLQDQINNRYTKATSDTRYYTREEVLSLLNGADTDVYILGGENVQITHNLDDFPSVHVVGEKGFGHYGFGLGQFGISDKFKVPNRLDYVNENTVYLSILENFNGEPIIGTLDGNKVKIDFSLEQVGVEVYFRTNNVW